MPINLDLQHPFDLELTMDIEIPALEWIPCKSGWKRFFQLDSTKVPVIIWQELGKIGLTPLVHLREFQVEELIKQTNVIFSKFCDEIQVGKSPILRSLQNQYSTVAYMKGDPFRSLIVTILSQIKTGEVTRQAFYQMDSELPDITPEVLSKVSIDKLVKLIRIAGPYKAKYIVETSRLIMKDFGGDFEKVVGQDTSKALATLKSFPGVGHKTAACVLVYSQFRNDTVPIDTHLFRTVTRIGLVDPFERLTEKRRKIIENRLIKIIPEAGMAHIFFVLLGRKFCYWKNPKCPGCPLGKGLCDHANKLVKN